jgi:hypothetical protein
VKYTWIDRNRTQWPIALACEVLGVSAGGVFPAPKKKEKRCLKPYFWAQTPERGGFSGSNQGHTR